ncbi:MAG: methyl-accepting chemotaxis protein [Pseudomonadota bacterium]
MKALDRLRLAGRIGSGFAVPLVLLGVVGGVGLWSATDMDRNIRATAEMNGDALLASEINADMAKALMHARTYLASQDAAVLDEARRFIEQTASGIAQAETRIQNPERAVLVDSMDQGLASFDAGLAEVVTLYAERDELYERLQRLGATALGHIQTIAEGAQADGDFETAWHGAAAREQLLEAKTSVLMFLLDNELAERDRFLNLLDDLDGALTRLDASVTNPQRQRALEDARAAAGDYAATAAAIADIVIRRNSIREAAIDETGFAISDRAAEMKSSAVADSMELGAGLTALAQRSKLTTTVIVAAGLVLGIVLAFVVGRAIARPLSTMTASMARIAEGDLQAEVPHRDRADEIGDMAKALQVFKEAAIERSHLTSELARTFETEVGGVIQTVAAAASQLSTTAGGVKESAGKTTAQAVRGSASAQQAASNVATVASASEELAHSVHEIGGQIERTRKIAGEASTAATRMRTTMSELAENATQIGSVLDLITSIAEQTNLLSLNATIEAARAGEAGRGFAVVAQEVKALAGQTQKATEDISRKIGALQEASRATGNDIESVGEVIRSMSDIATTIAAAMEEQTAATSDIARNVQEAATGNADVSAIIADVAEVARKSDASAEELTIAATALSGHAQSLHDKVGAFLEGLRAA